MDFGFVEVIGSGWYDVSMVVFQGFGDLFVVVVIDLLIIYKVWCVSFKVIDFVFGVIV